MLNWCSISRPIVWDLPMAELAEPNQPPSAAEPSAVSLPGRVIGVACEYADLLELIRARIRELGISHEMAGQIAGLPDGYISTLLCGRKKLGVLSLGCVMSALGLAIVITADDAQTLKIRPRLTLRRQSLPHAKPASGHWHQATV
jgi:hypothetical protein